MALIVNSQNRIQGPLKDTDLFHAGLALMILGLDTVDAKNRAEAQARIDFVNALDAFTSGRPTFRLDAAYLEGVTANVTRETTAAWTKRTAQRFMEARRAALSN